MSIYAIESKAALVKLNADGLFLAGLESDFFKAFKLLSGSIYRRFYVIYVQLNNLFAFYVAGIGYVYADGKSVGVFYLTRRELKIRVFESSIGQSVSEREEYRDVGGIEISVTYIQSLSVFRAESASGEVLAGRNIVE